MATRSYIPDYVPTAAPTLTPMTAGDTWGNFLNGQSNDANLRNWEAQNQNGQDWTSYRKLVERLTNPTPQANPYEQMALDATGALNAPTKWDALMEQVSQQLIPGTSEYDRLARGAASEMNQGSPYQAQLQELMAMLSEGGGNQYQTQLDQLIANPALAAANPAYRFALQQGTENLNRGAAASGNRLSGRAAVELADYGQGKASEQYFKMADFLGQMMDTQNAQNLGLANTLNTADNSLAGQRRDKFTAFGNMANSSRQSGLDAFGSFSNANNAQRTFDLGRFNSFAGQSNNIRDANLDNLKFNRSGGNMGYLESLYAPDTRTQGNLTWNKNPYSWSP